MTSESIYKEVILEHWRHPHNFGRIANPSKKSFALNPSCGDEIELELLLKNNRVKEAKFSGSGCAISQASSSLLTDYIRGKDIKTLKKIGPKDILKILGVPVSPTRMKCALLPLEALHKIIKK